MCENEEQIKSIAIVDPKAGKTNKNIYARPNYNSIKKKKKNYQIT